MKLTCGKTACQVVGRKPVMICPSSRTFVSTSKKQKQVKNFFGKEEDSSFLEETESSEESAGEESSDKEMVDESKRAMTTIHGAWKAITTPNKEDEVMGKWFGVVSRGRKVPVLHVAKLLHRLLNYEDGPVASVEMECLMAKVGPGDVLQATSFHLPCDIAIFPLEDVISGPRIQARDSRSYQVQGYENLKSLFKIYQTVDKDLLMEAF